MRGRDDERGVGGSRGGGKRLRILWVVVEARGYGKIWGRGSEIGGNAPFGKGRGRARGC